MDNELIIRAWKDPSLLPKNPSGRPSTELDDNELGGAVGGRQQELVNTVPHPKLNPLAFDISNGFRHGR